MKSSQFADVVNRLNIYFYDKVSSHFDSSRQYFWPGFEILKQNLPAKLDNLRVLDLGCGNARFGEFLQKHGLLNSYVGLDSDEGLIDEARQRYLEFRLEIVDLFSKNWEFEKQFDLVVSFGVMHHIANLDTRQSFFGSIRDALAGDGLVCISFWKFLDIDPKGKRVVFGPGKKLDDEAKKYLQKFKDETGLEFDNSDFLSSFGAGDYLLSWRRGEYGLRFCHDYTKSEIINLASQNGLHIESSWTADGPNDLGNDYYLFSKKRG